MTKSKTPAAHDPPQALRRLAQERLCERRTPGAETAPAQERERLLAELQIHQIELEIQNEELRRTQEALEASRARYFDLSGILEREVAQLMRLVDDLLDLAQIRRGTLALARRPCDLRAVAHSAAELVRPLLERGGQRLDLALPDTPATMDGDAERLAQAIGNLLRNASQLSPRGAAISLALESADGAATFWVRDRGAGIAPAMLPRLFDPFVQAEQGPERPAGGLGIGLALARGLVELHGGSVAAQSPGPGQGSTFGVRLPLSRDLR